MVRAVTLEACLHRTYYIPSTGYEADTINDDALWSSLIPVVSSFAIASTIQPSEMSRTEAEEYVFGWPIGTFVVRSSKSEPGKLVLTVMGSGLVSFCCIALELALDSRVTDFLPD